MINNPFMSGIVYDLTVMGDLTVEGAIDFGDIEASSMTITQLELDEVSTAGLSIVNTTPATVGTDQYSPSLYFRGSGWKSNAVAASQYTDGQIYMGAAAHTTNAIGTMTFQTRTNAGSWGSHFTISQYGVQNNVATYLNENTIQASNRTFSLNSNSDAGFKFSTPQTVDSLLFFLDSTSRTVILTDVANSAKDHVHTAQANPTLFIHSVKDPDTANDEWVSLTHDGTNGYIDLGSGALSINGAFRALGGIAGSGLGDSRIFSSGNAGTGWSLVNTSTGGKTFSLFSTGANSGTGTGKFSLFNVTDTSYLLTVTGAGEMILGSGDASLTALTGNTFRAPNVKTGGAGNIAGADMTIQPGLGTGTGDPGTIIFNTTIAAAAGDNIHTQSANTMVLDRGNVGIGVSDPAVKFHVVDGNGYARLSSNGGWFIKRDTAAAGDGIMNVRNSADALVFGIRGNGAITAGATSGTILNPADGSLNLDGNVISNGIADSTFAGSLSAVGVTLSGRLQGDKGSDIASANDITLGSDGNYFDITGTTQTERILGTGWQAGSVVILQFDGSVTVKNATAAGASYFGFKLAGAGDFSATADDTLTLVFDGAWWRETARTAI